MSALPLYVEDDVVPRTRRVFHVPLLFLPPQGLIMDRAPWLDWTLPPLRHLGGYYDRVAPRVGEHYDLPESDVSLVDAVSAW